MVLDAQTVRELALSLPEVEEQNHHGHPSFRVKNKIFATYWPDENRMVLKLSLADQTALTLLDSEAFSPVTGSWGEYGWTSVQLDRVGRDELEQALLTAWRQVAPRRLVIAHREQ